MIPLYDANPHRRTPYFVLLFIGVSVAVLLFEAALHPRALEHFVRAWGFVPARLWENPEGRYWVTPFTSMFLHAGWTHLVGNCWFLWLFGNNVEDRLGRVRFVVFYVLSGIGAVALQTAVAPFSPVPMIGASGAISGVLGAYFRYFPSVPIVTLVPIPFVPILPVPAFLFILVWFVFQFWQGIGSVFSTSLEGGVAWWAHVGGFAAGYVLAGVFRRRRGR